MEASTYNSDTTYDKWMASRQNNTRMQYPNSFEFIKVPSKCLGRIIGNVFSYFLLRKLIILYILGKGGSKIRDLQFFSGALINVTKEVEGDDTKIKIVGADNEIEAAKRLIEPFTEELKPKRENVRVMKLEEPPPPIPLDSIDWEKAGKECVSTQN